MFEIDTYQLIALAPLLAQGSLVHREPFIPNYCGRVRLFETNCLNKFGISILAGS